MCKEFESELLADVKSKVVAALPPDPTIVDIQVERTS